MTLAIEHILRKKTITNYLEQKGHFPAKRLSSGRLSYICPFPDHNEKKPSFIVWTEAEYENFHCFGCQRHNNIIHLVSFMEGITLGESIRKLAEGLEITFLEDGKYSVDMMIKECSNPALSPIGPEMDLGIHMMSLSSLCRSYLESVEFNEVECGIIDKLWSIVDSDIANFEIESIEETLQNITEVLRVRREKFENLKLEKLRGEYAGS